MAIAVLKEELEFNDDVQPICVDDDTNFVENNMGRNLMFVGWSPIDDNFDNLGPLRNSSIPVVSTIKCLTSNHLFFHILSENTTFCAGNNDGISGPCRGDAGAGLYYKQFNQWTLAGTVSTTLGNNGKCDLTNFAVFSDVGRYESWINESLHL